MRSTVPEAGTPPRPTLGTAMERLRHRWGWFLALGALSIVFGVLALGTVFLATLTTVYIIAIFMVVAGATEITVGFGTRTWGRSSLLVLAGLLYIVAGAFALARPGPAAVILTLALGITLLVAGSVCVVVGTHMAGHARTMVILGGSFTALVGLLIVLGWPTNSIVVLGSLLGIDLLFTGVMWFGFGLRLRSHA